MKVNFYWSGLNWKFINRLTIASHVRAGHEVIMWVNREATNEYWISDLPVEIKDAKEYVDTRKMLKRRWNLRTISTIFQYELMRKTGEYTADCDAIALKHWPDVPLVLCAESKQFISSVGVLRVPKKHPVLTCAKKRARKDWGNVRIFSKCCSQHKLKSTHKVEDFYPITCRRGRASQNLLLESKIPNSFSYHVFTNHRVGRMINHMIITEKKYKDSLLKKLCDWSFGDEFSVVRSIKK